ncbi:hydrolase [Archaeoglobales archaeon ex4484_92]|nr:MAG: hydrolase [Archaeoglobales archaeon ex4484_92]
MSFEVIAFDLDGTLIELNLPFDSIRRSLGIKNRFILETIMEERDVGKREMMLKILEDFEIKAAKKARRRHYAKEIVDLLRERGTVVGVITRNSRRSVNIVARNLKFQFDFVVTREDCPPKPSPEPVKLILNEFRIPSKFFLMVGDFIFDLLSGKRAGVKTALIRTEMNSRMLTSFIPYADYVFGSLKELGEFLGVMK